jgi:phage shock protein E
MNWTLIIIIAAGLGTVFLFKRMSFISEAAAVQYLKNGATIIDVRSSEEFRNGKVFGAMNIPLDELRDTLPRTVKDKDQVLLLHCLSGGRSGLAKYQVKTMGYTRVFNLGSVSRARTIVARAGER